MTRNYTDETIEILKQFPQIKHVSRKRLSFTYEYRLKLYEVWKNGGNIRIKMKDDGLPIHLFHRGTFKTTTKNFKKNGRPRGAKNDYINKNYYKPNTKAEIDYLLNSNIFIKKNGGIVFSKQFIGEAKSLKEKISIVELLNKYGVDIEIVGYQRIYKLEKLVNNNLSSTDATFNLKTQQTLKKSPYVARCSTHHFALHKLFYNEAYHLKHLNIIDILNIFEINHELLDEARIERIKYKLLNHNLTTNSNNIELEADLRNRIETRKIKVYENLIDKNFKNLKTSLPKLTKRSRKNICLWIKNFPLGHYNSVVGLLKKVGISKSNYYAILMDKDYVKREIMRLEKEKQDVALIKKVIEYKNFNKGSRLIYMMMERLTNTKMCRKKILRLMRKYNLVTQIRKKKQKSNLLQQRKQPNILNRKFKLARPMVHLLTDVSYLILNNQHFYLSSVIDAVTGKIVSFHISEYHDINLLDNTLEDVPKVKKKKKALLHGDQGFLYTSNHFNKRLKELGYAHSMSRRGNCWDNAPIESFFGHFKDECDYQAYNNLEELTKALSEYQLYFNEERPQWDRKKMTPLEYEQYLNDLNEEEFSEYLKIEQEKHEDMMEKAKIKAIKRAKDLGAII